MQNELPISAQKPPRVLIVGAGFAGINAARALRNVNVRITIVDRKNHHTFQPLLYQVALAVLSPAEIASPVRNILSGQKNVEVVMGEVVGFDIDNRSVQLKNGNILEYDYLIVAAGATHSYFGHNEWAPIAPGLKTLEDATEIRRRVLLAFELAEKQSVENGASPTPLNFVVIGAGPTGVELAGAISDIARRYMTEDFKHIDTRNTKVLLIEGGPRVLPAYSEDLSASAEKQLLDLNVDVLKNTMVTGIEPGAVFVGDKRISSAVTLWAAGVAASPLGKLLGMPTDRTGRVIVDEHCNPPGHSEIFVLGDLAHFEQDGKPIPGLAPAAMQMGKYVGKVIEKDLVGEQRQPFHYRDKGSMATIGHNRAIAQIGKLHLTGFMAWLAWLFIHVMFLIGFRNRLLVVTEWAWSYFAMQRGARLITGDNTLIGWGTAN